MWPELHARNVRAGTGERQSEIVLTFTRAEPNLQQTPTIEPIWVIVQPLATNSFWVQGKVFAAYNGQWSTTAQFGDLVPEHVGQGFAFRAVLEPRITLRKGMVLSDWPEARCQSPIVRVTRK